jgi:hypothetical protein
MIGSWGDDSPGQPEAWENDMTTDLIIEIIEHKAAINGFLWAHDSGDVILWASQKMTPSMTTGSAPSPVGRSPARS